MGNHVDVQYHDLYKPRWRSVLSNKHCCGVILNRVVVPLLVATTFEEHGNWLVWTILLYSLKVFFPFHFSHSTVGTGMQGHILNGS